MSTGTGRILSQKTGRERGNSNGSTVGGETNNPSSSGLKFSRRRCLTHGGRLIKMLWNSSKIPFLSNVMSRWWSLMLMPLWTLSFDMLSMSRYDWSSVGFQDTLLILERWKSILGMTKPEEVVSSSLRFWSYFSLFSLPSLKYLSPSFLLSQK